MHILPIPRCVYVCVSYCACVWLLHSCGDCVCVCSSASVCVCVRERETFWGCTHGWNTLSLSFSLTHQERARQVKDFLDVFRSLSPSLPLVCVCGNHDLGERPTRDTLGEGRREGKRVSSSSFPLSHTPSLSLFICTHRFVYIAIRFGLLFVLGGRSERRCHQLTTV